MQIFKVYGPYDIPLSDERTIGTDEINRFWDGETTDYKGSKELENLKECCGCYVFGIRSNGIMPWYVGKTDVTFGQEAFERTDKLYKYNTLALQKYNRGIPVMFFVCMETRHSSKAIDAVETYLIEESYAVNYDLINKCKLPKPDPWKIVGVTAPAPGRQSNAVTEFKAMLRY